MKLGKLTNEQLKEFIIDRLQTNRSEVIIGSGIGIDSAVLQLGGDYCTISTDPITAASKNAGKLAVHVSANDIAASGAEPFAVLVTLLVPPHSSLEEIGILMQDIFEEANALAIDVVGGHTEVTDAVNKPIISITALGRTDKVLSYENIQVGDALLLTKELGIEGALILGEDYKDRIAGVLNAEEAAALAGLKEQLSVLPEAKIAKEQGAIAMHDITEGGIYGAAYEMAEAAGLGLFLEKNELRLNPLAKKLTKHLGIDPYRLISSGSMLIACQADDAKGMLNALHAANITATQIGVFQAGNEVIADDEKIAPPTQDALFSLSS